MRMTDEEWEEYFKQRAAEEKARAIENKIAREKREKLREESLKHLSDDFKRLNKLNDERKKIHKKYEEDIGYNNLQIGLVISILYENGIQMLEIAKELKVSSTTVIRWREKGDEIRASKE